MRVRYEADAIDDLRQLVAYGITQGLPDPVGFVRSLRKRIASLATQPASGRPGRVPGTREWPLPGTKHIVVYQVDDHALSVLRVLHSSQAGP